MKASIPFSKLGIKKGFLIVSPCPLAFLPLAWEACSGGPVPPPAQCECVIHYKYARCSPLWLFPITTTPQWWLSWIINHMPFCLPHPKCLTEILGGKSAICLTVPRSTKSSSGFTLTYVRKILYIAV